jgi:hypothetical protein
MVACFILREGCLYNTCFFSDLNFKIFVAKDFNRTIVT